MTGSTTSSRWRRWWRWPHWNCSPTVADDLDIDGCRRLAGAVLARAFEHEGAAYADSPDFKVWSRILGLSPDVLARQIRLELVRGHRPSYHADRD